MDRSNVASVPALVEARWWERQADGRLLCTLCPRYCKIPEGKRGFCFIRRARDGKLWTAGYGRTTGFAIDPIEKKPLNHFLPGTRVRRLAARVATSGS